MKRINLRDYYPHAYCEDFFVEVDDEIARVLRTVEQDESALRRRMKRNRLSFISEHEFNSGVRIVRVIPEGRRFRTPDEVSLHLDLINAMSELSESQARRIYKHFILGMSKQEIARSESVCASSVKDSIRLGLEKMRELLK